MHRFSLQKAIARIDQMSSCKCGSKTTDQRRGCFFSVIKPSSPEGPLGCLALIPAEKHDPQTGVIWRAKDLWSIAMQEQNMSID